MSFDFGPVNGGGGGGTTPAYLTGQVLEFARSGTRPVGDYLRVPGNLAASSARGVSIYRDGKIREFQWVGTQTGGTGGDPIGLELRIIRGGSTISVTTVDCPSTPTNTVVTLLTPVDVQSGDAFAVRLSFASTGSASGANNTLFSAEVTP